jgi:hypothetical protein
MIEMRSPGSATTETRVLMCWRIAGSSADIDPDTSTTNTRSTPPLDEMAGEVGGVVERRWRKREEVIWYDVIFIGDFALSVHIV